MSVQDKYKFLEVVSEGQAVSRGVNLSDKNLHTLYRTIQRLSTVTSAQACALFTLETNVPGTMELRKVEIKNIIRKLIEFQLIVQIFRLDVSDDENKLKLVPCFIAATEENPEQIHRLPGADGAGHCGSTCCP